MKFDQVARGNIDYARQNTTAEREILRSQGGVGRILDIEMSKKSVIFMIFFNHQKHINANLEKSTMLFQTFLFPSPLAIPLGILVVRGDCDLETCRMYIDRLQEVSFYSQLFIYSTQCSIFVNNYQPHSFASEMMHLERNW